jgi:PleD family two-component response regulator
MDIAIVDLSMPRIDGFRLISIIRHTPELMRLPIMVVTSRTDQASVDEVDRLGANKHLAKPIDWAAFASRVDAVFKMATAVKPSTVNMPQASVAQGMWPGH